MTWGVWALFAVTETALCLSPGPAVLLVLSQALTRGTGQNGFVLQAANPKALIFFTALLPQFIDPRVPVMTQVALLGMTSVIIEFTLLLAYGALAGRMAFLATRPRFRSAADRVAGSMLITAGVSMAAIRRT
jgi:homoserine/homoserine lactone efflux protein